VTPFPTITFVDVFPEDLGFVLCDRLGLDRFHGSSAKGLDLLTLYSSSDRGDEVSKDGIVIPAYVSDYADYTVVIRHAAVPSTLETTSFGVSRGWVFKVTGEVCLTDMSILRAWDPDSNRVYRFSLPLGDYAVDVIGHVAGEQWVLEFVMTPKGDAQFTATLNQTFDFSTGTLREPEERHGDQSTR
jgi:hypothetical protein